MTSAHQIKTEYEAAGQELQTVEAMFGVCEDFAWPVGLLAGYAFWDNGWFIGVLAFFCAAAVSLMPYRGRLKRAKRRYAVAHERWAMLRDE